MSIFLDFLQETFICSVCEVSHDVIERPISTSSLGLLILYFFNTLFLHVLPVGLL